MAFIMNQIKESPVNKSQGYVYSDLHYYTYPQFVPLITGKDWETYLKTTYKSLGASTLTYNPRRFRTTEADGHKRNPEHWLHPHRAGERSDLPGASDDCAGWVHEAQSDDY